MLRTDGKQSSATRIGISTFARGKYRSMEDRPITRKLSTFVHLSESELTVLEQLHSKHRTFGEGCDLIAQGQNDQATYILTDGWACSYKLQASGSRQIVDFQIPGDFLGLRSMLLHTSDHSIVPVGEIEAVEVTISDLIGAFSSAPRLGIAILWAASRDEAMVVEHLVGIGQRNANERTAHLMLELSSRLSMVGIGSRSGFDCPLTQYHLADALGLSAIHVNRVLRNLRESDFVTFRNGRVEFNDYDGLVRFADFDPVYLYNSGPLLT